MERDAALAFSSTNCFRLAEDEAAGAEAEVDVEVDARALAAGALLVATLGLVVAEAEGAARAGAGVGVDSLIGGGADVTIARGDVEPDSGLHAVARGRPGGGSEDCFSFMRGC